MNRSMFTGDPFDLAPGAPGHTRASWLVLFFGFTFALLCGLQLERSATRLASAESAGTEQRKQARALAKKEAEVRLARSDPAALERAKAQQKVQQLLRMSWSGLFDILETAGSAAGGRATVLSLAPIGAQEDDAQVSISALAGSESAMLDYVRALQDNVMVRNVELLMQQPATSDGVAGVRFQLTLQWDARK